MYTFIIIQTPRKLNEDEKFGHVYTPTAIKLPSQAIINQFQGSITLVI